VTADKKLYNKGFVRHFLLAVFASAVIAPSPMSEIPHVKQRAEKHA
jgi:hypothetical protein